MIVQVIWIGALVGLVHFVILGMLYGNPVVGKMYQQAQATEPSVKKWPKQGKYLLTQFLGTQGEVFIITFGFIWLKPLLGMENLTGAICLGLLFSAIRIYPRFWNMWIQSNYPNKLLAVEFVNGFIGTIVMALTLNFLVK